ncbi:hypothetical protein B5F97_12085 [Bacteroides clarus]|uniref:Uncharacterized protein n=1 Tax=Bacteroides clarus TaxID=626929 RepID=A0A1Y3YYP0_9BACE|nr:hypothetical protein B5F97_12085 [Bacteroides clarus]
MTIFTKLSEKVFQMFLVALALCMIDVQKQTIQYVLLIYLDVTALSIAVRQLLDFLVRRPKTLGVFIVME